MYNEMQKERNFIPSFGGAEDDSVEIYSNFFALDIQGSILGSKGIDPLCFSSWGSILYAMRIDRLCFLSRKYVETNF